MNIGRSALSLCAPTTLPLAISFPETPLIATNTIDEADRDAGIQLNNFPGRYVITDDEC